MEHVRRVLEGQGCPQAAENAIGNLVTSQKTWTGRCVVSEAIVMLLVAKHFSCRCKAGRAA